MSRDHRIVDNGDCNLQLTQPNDHPFRSFEYLLTHGLSLSNEFVGSLKSRVSQESLQEKKLHLVLSLCGTLFDGITVGGLSNKEKYLKGKELNREGGLLWQTRIYGQEVLIKLRPFVHEFLREANKLFILHVQTRCYTEYGAFVLNLIDPDRLYFGDRIIPSQTYFWDKTLDSVLAGEGEVIILDDRYETWWPEDISNLLQITTYSYFRATTDLQVRGRCGGGMIHNLYKRLMKRGDNNMLLDSSYAEQRTDESVEGGALANALGFLTKVHNNFFYQDYKRDPFYKRDVRVFLHS